MASVAVQNATSSIQSPSATQFSAADIDDQTAGVTNQTGKADFKDLLSESNEQIRRQREEEKQSGLSGKESQQEFLNKLNGDKKPGRENINKNQMAKDDFLKLFVTQLQNQNPLNPEADTEMAAKLAQFNSLEQMLNVNKSLETMIGEQKISNRFQLSSLIGKQTTITKGLVHPQMLDKATVLIKLPKDASSSKAEIKNKKGETLQEITLGPLSSEQTALDLKGKLRPELPNDVLEVVISAQDADGKKIEAKVQTMALITGVENEKDKTLAKTALGRFSLEELGEISLAEKDMGLRQEITKMMVPEQLPVQADGQMPLPVSMQPTNSQKAKNKSQQSPLASMGQDALRDQLAASELAQGLAKQ